MSLTKFNGATNNIRGLADKPTQSALQLKTLFDKTGDDLKTYINETLTTEIDTALGTKADSSNVYLKGDFAILTGKMNISNEGGYIYFNYPPGFDDTNCVVISTGISIGSNSTDYCFDSIQQVAFIATHFLIDRFLVMVTNFASGTLGGDNHNVKVVLMKIS